MKSKFSELVSLSAKREVLKKLVFSRPIQKDIAEKVSGRLCAHRGRRILSLEYSLSGNTVSQKNIPEDNIEEEVLRLLTMYMQANLITTASNAEYKISKGGREVLLGADALMRKLSGEAPRFETAIEELDKRKNYILNGDEQFLISLGISDKSGRIHDKKQGKWRQINRFLLHIEDIYSKLPCEGTLRIYDLCSGKSYLSFAVYHYLTVLKGRTVDMLGIDLKRDVILRCEALARELKFTGMHFITGDVRETPRNISPDLVISLHACDIATDIVIDTAASLGAKVILSTPCCHSYLNSRICNSELSFVTEYGQLKNKLCEAFTDAIRIARLRKFGYSAQALELTDPENTPKNTLIRAFKETDISDAELSRRASEYEHILDFVLGDGKKDYLSEIK